MNKETEEKLHLFFDYMDDQEKLASKESRVSDEIIVSILKRKLMVTFSEINFTK